MRLSVKLVMFALGFFIIAPAARMEKFARLAAALVLIILAFEPAATAATGATCQSEPGKICEKGSDGAPVCRLLPQLPPETFESVHRFFERLYNVGVLARDRQICARLIGRELAFSNDWTFDSDKNLHRSIYFSNNSPGWNYQNKEPGAGKFFSWMPVRWYYTFPIPEADAIKQAVKELKEHGGKFAPVRVHTEVVVRITEVQEYYSGHGTYCDLNAISKLKEASLMEGIVECYYIKTETVQVKSVLINGVSPSAFLEDLKKRKAAQIVSVYTAGLR